MSNHNCTYFLQDLLSPNTHLVISVLLMLLLGFLVLKRKSGELAKIGLLLLMIGGLHNLWQRVMYICVWDNIDFFGLFVFNPSDLSITIGTVLIFLDLFIDGKKNIDHRR